MDTSKLLKAERSAQVIHVPIRLGKRKVVCSCGQRFRIEKSGRFDFILCCKECGVQQAVSILRRREVLI